MVMRAVLFLSDKSSILHNLFGQAFHLNHNFRVDWEEKYNKGERLVGDFTIWDGEWWTTERHIYLYAIFMGFLIIFITSRSFAFYKMCLRASMNLHDKLFRGITRSVMYFFHTNASGRILNRFSKDMGSIDSMLPTVLVDCINVSD